MKIYITIIMFLLGGVVLAAPRQKQSIVIFDPTLDAEVFSLIPTPATCELHVLTSNNLVWVQYEGRMTSGVSPQSTMVYIQRRFNQKPISIIKFGGRRMPKVIGASSNGSLLFERGEEFIISGDASARSSSEAATFFQADIREACPFDVQSVTSPSIFMRRLSEDKPPTFTLLVFRKEDKTTMRELTVKAIPGVTPFWTQVKSGALPSPEQLRHLWPIAQWDKTGFTIWNGTEWNNFKWDTNK